MILRSSLARATGSAALFLLLGAPSVHGQQRFSDACDGSAIVDVGDGYFLAATDEDNTLRLYKRGSDGLPIQRFPLSDKLATELNKKGVPKEADIEGVAQIGTCLYWIGSHSEDSKGNAEPSRHRLFATDRTGRGAGTRIAFTGTPFTGLAAALAALPDGVGDAVRRSMTLAPDAGGLNIEALVATPAKGLLIGLRGPLLNGKAIAVELLNPADVVSGKAEPKLGPPYQLDLGQHGIRALEPKPTSGYWLISGPMTDGGPFRLYEWRPGTRPVLSKKRLPATPGNMEGLMNAGEALWVASDAGGVISGGTECKDKPVDKRAFELVQCQGHGVGIRPGRKGG